MFKVMIADDNPHFLKDLSEYLDWEIFDFDLVGSFRNGKELLDAASANTPDLVITDVDMPQMDGFELSSQLYRLNPNLTIVFISGYPEFNYAQKALKLGIFDYILKPLNGSNLLQCLDKVHQKLLRTQLIQLEQQNSLSQKDYFRKTALSHYVGSLLFYATDSVQIENSLLRLGYKCSMTAQHYVARFSIDRCSTNNTNGDESKTDADFFQMILSSNTSEIQIVPCLIENNAGSFLLSSSDPSIIISDFFSTLCVDMEVNLNLRIHIGYAGPCENFTELPKLHIQAQKVHTNLLINPSISPIASSKDIPLESDKEVIISQPQSTYSSNVIKMRKYIEQQYMNHITTHDVARYVYLSSSYANTCFFNECGTTIFNYIVQVRMDNATKLLRESDLPVTTIAEQVGYSSKTSFYLAFKRFSGISPTEYRSQEGVSE